MSSTRQYLLTGLLLSLSFIQGVVHASDSAILIKDFSAFKNCIENGKIFSTREVRGFYSYKEVNFLRIICLDQFAENLFSKLKIDSEATTNDAGTLFSTKFIGGKEGNYSSNCYSYIREKDKVVKYRCSLSLSINQEVLDSFKKD